MENDRQLVLAFSTGTSYIQQTLMTFSGSASGFAVCLRQLALDFGGSGDTLSIHFLIPPFSGYSFGWDIKYAQIIHKSL